MSKVDDIINLLLGDRRISESATFTGRTYTDQPLIERGSDLKARMDRRDQARAERHQREAEQRLRQRTARQARAGQLRHGRGHRHQDELLGQLDALLSLEVGRGADPDLPEPLRRMRELEQDRVPASLSYGSRAQALLFWQQAVLTQDYEDDVSYHGDFAQYYPTYASLTDRQLRGYFAWRTRVRAGQVDPAPLPFAFIHTYELLCGIGTSPGRRGLEDLRAFGRAYAASDEFRGAKLDSYLRRWLRDYAVYHGLDDELGAGGTGAVSRAALVLMRAEHALLARDGRGPRIESAAAQAGPPSAPELFDALDQASSYRIGGARLAKDEGELLAAVSCDVFGGLVSHCSKRRKTDFVEGLFGYGSTLPYTMFSSAIFYDDRAHPDAVVRVSEVETFTCTDGRWRHQLANAATKRSSELGLILHTVDYELREALSYAYPLKQREVPAYVTRMIRGAIAARLAEREELRRRRLTIDRSKLGGIRKAASLTQEALLTDEERDNAERMPKPQVEPQASPPTQVDAMGGTGPLTFLETRFLRAVITGADASQLLSGADPFPSVVADSINDKLFDLVGDAVIEFEGDRPQLVEDYRADVEDVLGP